MTKEIPLTQGMVALVDDGDYAALSKHVWCIHSGGYATTPKSLLMHRVIMGLARGDRTYIDHINGNKLDNRRCNLRLCTMAQNIANAKKRANTSSRFKGVYFDASRNQWQAYINVSGKRIHIGRFNTELEAARAYDRKAREHYGEFAKLNLEG